MTEVALDRLVDVVSNDARVLSVRLSQLRRIWD